LPICGINENKFVFKEHENVHERIRHYEEVKNNLNEYFEIELNGLNEFYETKLHLVLHKIEQLENEEVLLKKRVLFFNLEFL
jgi:hypothetical protein